MRALDGMAVLVTGATGAIGRAIVAALAAEGARVAIHYGRDRDGAERLLDGIGDRGWCVQADFSRFEGATALWEEAEALADGFMALPTTPACGRRCRSRLRSTNGRRCGSARYG